MKRRMEEVREERADTSSSSSDNDEEVTSPVNWENIGVEEEMYLASTMEELYEMIMRKETFLRKVEEMKTEVLMRLMCSFLTYSRQNIEELQLAQPEEEEVSPEERSQIGRFTALITFQHRRII